MFINSEKIFYFCHVQEQEKTNPNKLAIQKGSKKLRIQCVPPISRNQADNHRRKKHASINALDGRRNSSSCAGFLCSWRVEFSAANWKDCSASPKNISWSMNILSGFFWHQMKELPVEAWFVATHLYNKFIQRLAIELSTCFLQIEGQTCQSALLCRGAIIVSAEYSMSFSMILTD